jgi:hypothetical protein
VDRTLHVFDNKIQVIEPGKAAPLDFTYDNLFSNQHDFIKSSFNKVVSPLLKQTEQGESTMVIFGGLQSLKLNEFLLSHTVMQGLISQTASHLLNSVNEGDHKIGSVTFSWFKIDCGSPEILTDVLKTASTNANAGGSGKAATDSLVLRELGKGRGMVVPGLWEVEIAGGSDIEAVINHLQKIVPDAADHSVGNAHTVMHLTVTNQKLAAQGKGGSQGQSKSHSALGTVADGPGVGRITFLLLSNLAPSLNIPKSPGSRSATPTGAGRTSFYPWVEHTKVVMQWLESKRASTPFHKSRLLLLLKDVLMRRQKASMLMMLQPSHDQHAVNLQWMKLIQQMSSDTGGANEAATSSATAGMPPRSGTTSSSAASSRSSTPNNAGSNRSSNNLTNNSSSSATTDVRDPRDYSTLSPAATTGDRINPARSATPTPNMQPPPSMQQHSSSMRRVSLPPYEDIPVQHNQSFRHAADRKASFTRSPSMGGGSVHEFSNGDLDPYGAPYVSEVTTLLLLFGSA